MKYDISDKSAFIVNGKEAEALLKKAKEKWNYDPDVNWFPIAYEGLEISFDCFFISEHFIKEYDKKIFKDIFNLLFKGDIETIYYVPLKCIDDSIYKFNRYQIELYKDDCTEYACLPENMSWIYYQSHEFTISFAGTIFKQMQRILSPLKNKWNIFSYG